jgi:hypothetical protein
MNTKFDLSNAHRSYQRDIPAILQPLMERYPGTRLRMVRLCDPKLGDTSMGATYPGGEIRLNAYWFARDPKYMSAAAERCSVVDGGGVQMGWHGPMVQEPQHLLTHEFGHVVWQCLPQREVEEWAGDRWRQATVTPHLAPSGYALANSEEFFGEMFALVHLGCATDEEGADLDDLIGRLRS